MGAKMRIDARTASGSVRISATVLAGGGGNAAAKASEGVGAGTEYGGAGTEYGGAGAEYVVDCPHDGTLEESLYEYEGCGAG